VRLRAGGQQEPLLSTLRHPLLGGGVGVRS
jgi:hypothetical protein